MLDGVITDVMITPLTFVCPIDILRGATKALTYSGRPLYLAPSNTPSITAPNSTINLRMAGCASFAAAEPSFGSIHWKGLPEC